MSIDEVIKVLEQERTCVMRQIGSGCDRDCANCDLVMDDSTVLSAYNEAIASLQYRELLHKTQQLDNKPLTMDELREMDGEPVLVNVSENWRKSGVEDGWRLVRFHKSDDRVRIYIYDTHFGATFLAEQDCGISWWAYRRKPNDWISIKKRPPEYDAPVWGWDAQCHCAKEVNYLNGEFFDVFGEDADISHWMPLPAPPEVE